VKSDEKSEPVILLQVITLNGPTCALVT